MHTACNSRPNTNALPAALLPFLMSLISDISIHTQLRIIRLCLFGFQVVGGSVVFARDDRERAISELNE